MLVRALDRLHCEACATAIAAGVRDGALSRFWSESARELHSGTDADGCGACHDMFGAVGDMAVFDGGRAALPSFPLF